MSTPIPEAEWKWFGNAGHFICSQWCRFHLCTQVGPWLISSVGQYVHPRHSQGNERQEAKWLQENWPGEDIGSGRKYETLVFLAGEPCSTPGCGCGMPTLDDPSEVDGEGCNTAKEATANHYKYCRSYAAKDVPT